MVNKVACKYVDHHRTVTTIERSYDRAFFQPHFTTSKWSSSSHADTIKMEPLKTMFANTTPDKLFSMPLISSYGREENSEQIPRLVTRV